MKVFLSVFGNKDFYEDRGAGARRWEHSTRALGLGAPLLPADTIGKFPSPAREKGGPVGFFVCSFLRLFV